MNEIVDTVEDLLEKEFGMQVDHGRMKLPERWPARSRSRSTPRCSRSGLYQQKIHVLSEMNKTIACSVEKASRDLGYAPGVELREGMRRSIEWCLANGQEI